LLFCNQDPELSGVRRIAMETIRIAEYGLTIEILRSSSSGADKTMYA